MPRFLILGISLCRSIRNFAANQGQFAVSKNAIPYDSGRYGGTTPPHWQRYYPEAQRNLMLLPLLIFNKRICTVSGEVCGESDAAEARQDFKGGAVPVVFCVSKQERLYLVRKNLTPFNSNVV